MKATEPAAATHDAQASGYEAYAQLAKILLPSSGCLAIYAIDGDLSWCSDGFERPDFRELIEDVMSSASAPRVTEGVIRETSGGVSALVSSLTDPSGNALGYALIELGTAQSDRIQSLASSLTRPLFACLASQIALERPVVAETVAAEPAASMSEVRLQTLLRVGEIDYSSPSAVRRLLDLCVGQLDCLSAVFCVPDLNLTEIAERDGANDDNTRSRLDSTRRHLLAWVQLNNRPMVVNRIDSDKAPYKILSCPVTGKDGSASGLLALFRNAQGANFELDDVRLIEFISHQAMSLLHERQDALSGLLSRPAFERAVDDALRKSRNGAMLFLDVDDLKTINDAFGYPVGDEVIRRVAQLITRGMTDVELACRLAGDRFVVFSPERDSDEALSLGQELASSAEGLGYETEGRKVPISVSVGSAAPPDSGLGSRHWIAAAELSCQQAKASRQGSL